MHRNPLWHHHSERREKKTLHGPWVISTAYRAKHVVNKVISTWYFFCYRATYLTFSETTAMSQPPDPASQGSYTLVQTLPVWPPQIPTQLSHREFSGARDIIQCFKMVMLCA